MTSSLPARAGRGNPRVIAGHRNPGRQVAAIDGLVPDIPVNVVAEAGKDRAVNIGLGTLREQLQHVAAF